MSNTERNKGRLTPIGDRTLTLKELNEPWEYGLMKINNKFYEIEYEIENDDELNFADVTIDEHGIIEFHTLHYNGGASLEEVIGHALTR